MKLQDRLGVPGADTAAGSEVQFEETADDDDADDDEADDEFEAESADDAGSVIQQWLQGDELQQQEALQQQKDHAADASSSSLHAQSIPQSSSDGGSSSSSLQDSSHLDGSGLSHQSKTAGPQAEEAQLESKPAGSGSAL